MGPGSLRPAIGCETAAGRREAAGGCAKSGPPEARWKSPAAKVSLSLRLYVLPEARQTGYLCAAVRLPAASGCRSFAASFLGRPCSSVPPAVSGAESDELVRNEQDSRRDPGHRPGRGRAEHRLRCDLCARDAGQAGLRHRGAEEPPTGGEGRRRPRRSRRSRNCWRAPIPSAARTPPRSAKPATPSRRAAPPSSGPISGAWSDGCAPRMAGFDYSGGMKSMGGSWTVDDLNQFLAKPQAFVPGTKMTFAGLTAAANPGRRDRLSELARRTIPPPLPKAADAARPAPRRSKRPGRFDAYRRPGPTARPFCVHRSGPALERHANVKPRRRLRRAGGVLPGRNRT